MFEYMFEIIGNIKIKSLNDCYFMKKKYVEIWLRLGKLIKTHDVILRWYYLKFYYDDYYDGSDWIHQS